MSSGYPTPDNPEMQTFTNVCITIPSSIEDVFYQVLLGQISEMAKEYYWKAEGTMTPEMAAFLWSQTLAMTSGDLEECSTMSCEDVADCIESNAATQAAIQAFLESAGYGSGQGTPTTPSIYTGNQELLDGSQITGCDNDSLFGAVTQLVDLMNTMLTDFFEFVEGETEQVEKWAALLEAIPITNILAIDDLIQFADQLIENIAQSYAAEYTAQLRDEFRCDLFCLVKDTCELSFQAWADYFMGLLGEAIVDNAFSNTIAWFTGGNFSNEEIVYAGHALICQVFAYGSKWLDFDMAWFAKVVTASMNDPDSDWTILCTECADDEWCYSLDLTAFALYDFSGSIGTQNMGTLNGSQWDSSNANVSAGQGFMRGIAIGWAFGLTATINRVEIDYSAVEGVATGGAIINPARVFLRTGGTTNYDSQASLIPDWGSTLTADFTGISQSCDNIRIWQNTDNTSSDDRSGSGNITGVRIYGTGTNPFGADNC
jgi:hypothetical protein